MNILICFDKLPPEPWVQGLALAFPGAHVAAWTPGAPQADHAIVWAPPQQFIDEQPGLQTLFNIGAGVDALLQLKLPPSLKVVRLDDAGMSVQMAEFVCHAVIRHFRELDGYDADAQAGKWSYRKPRSRADFAVGVMGLGVLGERVARALQVFDFPVNGYSRSPKDLAGIRCFSGAQALPEFLAATRVLVNLMPLTPETENILNHATLSQLQKGGYVINVARGKHLVDEGLLALID
ncbi:MAG: Glyoxylate/hydroxypyruvate reductase, partial [Pseudomonadota bacterium]